ncbi:helix-turn-helix transcriptional regulator [Clostridium perfringens]|nr:helix-turn-helix transcriptional regulator [Clostridium perfringens]
MIGLEYLNEIYGLSATDLGKRINVSRQTVNDWLRERRIIPKKHYEKLKEIFNGIPEEFFNKQLTELNKLKIQKLKLEDDKIKLVKQAQKSMLKDIVIDKTTIILDQAISKADGKEFTNEELEEFLNDYIEWIENKGLITGGSCGFDRGEE